MDVINRAYLGDGVYAEQYGGDGVWLKANDLANPTDKIFLEPSVIKALFRFSEEGKKPRFDETFCSQCGQGFGPGNHGFSHCDDHEGQEPVDDVA